MDIRYDEGENMKRVLSYIFGAVWCVCIILLALNSSTETVKLSDKAFEFVVFFDDGGNIRDNGICKYYERQI